MQFFYTTLLCDVLHTEQFIYTALSHTCLDPGCFMVFKHTISCQLLHLHSSLLLQQMFLINSKRNINCSLSIISEDKNNIIVSYFQHVITADL